MRQLLRCMAQPIAIFLLGIVFALPAAAGPAAGQELGELLRNHIRETYPWAGIEVSEISVTPPIPAEAPSRIIVEKNPPGRTQFLFEYSGGRTLSVAATVKAFDPVVMSRRAFGKGYRLQQEDVYTTLMDVSRIPKDAVSGAARTAGKTLTRQVSANTPLTEGMISGAVAVKRGRRVMLVVEARGLSVTAVGEMKDDGIVGGYAKAVNLSSRKTVSGLLVDENTIRVEF